MKTRPKSGEAMNLRIAPIRLAAMAFILFAAFGCNKNCLNLLRAPASDFALSERVNHGQLANGLSYYVLKNEQPRERCYLRLHVSVGSFFEADHERGMAHMVEHLAFYDRIVSKDESLSEWFQKHGMAFGPDANAFTTTDTTVYKIDLPTCTKESVTEALQIFHSFAQGLLFDQAAIDKEKKIIDAEEREYKNTHGDISEKIVENLYSGTPYVTRKVLGDQKTRAQFSQAMIRNFYETWYQPQNLSVVVVGDYKELPINTMIGDIFGSLKQYKKPGLPPRMPKTLYEKPTFVIHDKEIPYVETVFSIQTKKIERPVFKKGLVKDRLAFELAITMLSNQYNAMAKSNPNSFHAPSISGYMYDSGNYELALSVADKPDAYEKSFTEAYLLLRSRAELGFDEEDFRAVREMYEDSFRQWVIEEPTWNSSTWADRVINHIGKRSFLYSGDSFQKVAAPLLAELTAKDCQQALKNAFKSGNHYLFSIGAIDENEQTVKKLETLLADANRVPFAKPESLTKVVFQYPVESCKDISVASRKALDNVNAELFTFANNVTLAVKKTDFKKDEIVVELFTDEGFSTMNERDFAIARIAQWALTQGGLGKHPPEHLPSLFLNKIVTTSLAVRDNRIQATIHTRNQDFSFMVAFMRALILDPLYSEVALKRIKEALAINYQSSAHNMLEPLAHSFLKELTEGDYRVGRVPLEMLQSITRDDLLAWHKKYIAGKPLNIVVVGDVDPEHIKNEVGCIFSDLPKNAPTSRTKPTRITYKSGINRVYDVDTTDATSKVNLVYPLMFPSEKYPDHRLRILQDLVQESLRLKLREKRQATYAANVVIKDGKEPYAQNILDIFVAVTKEDAPRIKDDIKKILNKLAIRGVRDQELIKAKEPYLAAAQQLMSQNGYWSMLFANNFSSLSSLHWIATLPTDIKAVSARDINELMKKYLRDSMASTAIVHAKK